MKYAHCTKHEREDLYKVDALEPKILTFVSSKKRETLYPVDIADHFGRDTEILTSYAIWRLISDGKLILDKNLTVSVWEKQ